jgi:hypothetical protein
MLAPVPVAERIPRSGPIQTFFVQEACAKNKIRPLRQAEYLAAETAQVDDQTELEKLTAEQQQPNNRQPAAAFYVSMPI